MYPRHVDASGGCYLAFSISEYGQLLSKLPHSILHEHCRFAGSTTFGQAQIMCIYCIFVYRCMGTMAQIDRVVKLKFYYVLFFTSWINWAKAPLKASLAFCPELLRLEPWHMATAPLDHQTSAAKSPAFRTYAIALALEQRIKPGRIFQDGGRFTCLQQIFDQQSSVHC